MYSKLQNLNKVFLDCRLGPTLSCLVEEKLNYQISYFSATAIKPSDQVKMEERERFGVEGTSRVGIGRKGGSGGGLLECYLEKGEGIVKDFVVMA